MADINGFIKAAKAQGITDNAIEQVLTSKGYQMPKSVGGFIGNVGKSAVNTVGGIGSAILNTVNPDMEKNTIANLAKLGIDAAKIVAGDQSEQNKMKQLINFYVDRYGGIDKIGDTVYKDPIGFLLDVSTVAGGVGAGLKGAGAISEVNGLTKAGNVFSKIAEVSDPFSMTGKLASKVAPRNVFRNAGNTLIDSSENLLTKGLGSPQELAKVKKISGMSNRDLFRKFNLYDRTPEAVQEAISGVNSTRSGLIKSGSTIKVGDIVKSFDDQIKSLSEDAKISENAASQMAELTNRRNLILKSVGGDINAAIPSSRVDEIRALIGKDIPESSFGLSVSDMGKRGGTVSSYRTMRDLLDESSGTKNLGRQESALIKFKDIVNKAQNRASARQNINFTKLGLAGAGGLVKGFPGAVGGFFTEQIANSPQFLSATSRGLEKTGEMLKTARMPKIPYSNGIYNTGKAGRMINSTIPTNQKQINQEANGFGIKNSKVTPSGPSSSSISRYNPNIPKTAIQSKTNFVPTVKIPKQRSINFSKTNTVRKGNFY